MEAQGHEKKKKNLLILRPAAAAVPLTHSLVRILPAVYLLSESAVVGASLSVFDLLLFNPEEQPMGAPRLTPAD